MIKLEILSNSLEFIYCATLIIAIIICKRLSIKPAFYFFIILTIEFIYGLLLSYYMQNNDMSQNRPFGLTIGEFLTYSSILAAFIQIAAYVVLVVGLYLWWRKNPEKV